LRAGVLIIGSLFWDENGGREEWRRQRLKAQGCKRVAVPIRYGRFSDNRHAYTMVFSTLCYKHNQLGQGVVLPFTRSIKSLDDLLCEVECLANAEGLSRNWQWGAVGILKNPAFHLPRDIVQGWTKYFRQNTPNYRGFTAHTRSEAPVIDRKGFLHIRWPVASDHKQVAYDLLLATPTKPKIKDSPAMRRYPRPKEVAQCALSDETEYFLNNVTSRIDTSQDASIWKWMSQLQPDFTAKRPNITSLLNKS
jgi:hypothetical protein